MLKSQPEYISETERCRFTINGAVQGVGFRPFVYKLAMEHELCGWVQNNTSGVVIEVEGTAKNIADFEISLKNNTPPNAVIDHFESFSLVPQNEAGFEIIQSDDTNDISVSILPDLALCPDCRREMNDPADRRYRYPFINCTNCGPRYTIMKALPYDRPHTSMAAFKMCGSCLLEYEDPLDRRFHAQPVACPQCGPELALWDGKGTLIASREDALLLSSQAIREGKILALKGLGGFHLIADATNENTTQLLRKRKNRKTKPFALMYPSLSAAEKDCFISAEEKKLLCSAAAPIVLLQRKNTNAIAPSAAPDNPFLGVMLPYTPVHDLLLKELGFPIIATSGNRASEPICIDEHEALEKLSGIADLFLVHNRPIINRADDSIVRITAERPLILRRGRGYAPLPILLKKNEKNSVLAVGGHLKNTIAFAKENRLILSPHIGDLDTPEACDAHEQAINTLISLYREEPDFTVHDNHPDYRSTSLAQKRFKKTASTQHHYAHALSCMIDNNFDKPCLAVVWDGTGYGDDGTLWGGEFLKITPEGYERAAHLLPFPLPGGEAAIRDPRRAALGILFTLQKEPDFSLFPEEDTALLWQAMNKKINAPLTSSAGRLFDVAAFLTGLCRENSFEGQAAMTLEFAAMKHDTSDTYDFKITDNRIDWRPMITEILKEGAGAPQKTARKFHNTLSAIIVAFSQKQYNQDILLTGGCFQNKLLLETTIKHLRDAGFEPHWHRQIPPNDGGLAAGQAFGILREKQ